MNRKDTFLVIGGSPFINDIKEDLSYLTCNFKSIGINRSAADFKTSHCAFLDSNTIGALAGSLIDNAYIISCPNNSSMIDLYPNGDYHEIFAPSTDEYPIKDNKYSYFGFTHDFVIAWCIEHEIENIILIGTADFDGNEHYHCRYPFNRSPKVERKSIDRINNYFTKYINIYTLNPNSKLSVPRVTLEDLNKMII